MKKNLLEEDNEWLLNNEDESLSLISNGSETARFLERSKRLLQDDKTYPLMYLVVFIITNIMPVFVSCYYDKQFERCVSWSQAKPHPIISLIYQIGNAISTMLAYATFYAVYKYQKTRFSVPNLKHKQSLIGINLALGCLASSVYLIYTIVVSEDYLMHKLSFGEDHILYVYYVLNSVYNSFNFHLMYILIKEQNASNPEHFMLNFKLSVFLIKINLTILYFLMLIGTSLFTMQNTHYQSFLNYLVYLVGIITLLSHQIYTALYYNDISFIHKQFYQRVDYQFFMDKKLYHNTL